MTEAEWLACEDPRKLLACVRDNASDRKLILFSVAVIRRISEFQNASLRRLHKRSLTNCENYADGLIALAQMRRTDSLPNGRSLVEYPQEWAWEHTRSEDYFPNVTPEYRSALVRDIFGNPFRPVACEPSWLTSDVLALALGIYDERALDRMPILADALQDAGCANDDVLSHCRDPKQVHVRGCWVLDLLLGKG